MQAIHRLISGIGDLDVARRTDATLRDHRLGPNTPDAIPGLDTAMQAEGGLGLVDREGIALLVPRPELELDLAGLPAQVRRIDAARFEVGIRPSLGSPELAYRHDAAAVAGQVAKGSCDAGVLLRPVTVDQIREAAAAGVRMPEKTTFFAPKPRTGMVFRRLDD